MIPGERAVTIWGQPVWAKRIGSHHESVLNISLIFFHRHYAHPNANRSNKCKRYSRENSTLEGCINIRKIDITSGTCDNHSFDNTTPYWKNQVVEKPLQRSLPVLNRHRCLCRCSCTGMSFGGGIWCLIWNRSECFISRVPCGTDVQRSR